MIDYKLLEAVAMAISEGGFEKAAFRLNITQSAISQRIKLLEEQSGTILLTRTTPPKATPAGQQFLKHYTLVKRLEGDLNLSCPGILPEPKSARQPEQIEQIALGINADSLSTWFQDTMTGFLNSHKITFDLKIDDQEETHNMLKEGTVLGCISSRSKPIQGCRSSYLGSMNYRMTSTPLFKHTYFKNGITPGSLSRAPAVIFNRKDDLLNKCLQTLNIKTVHGFPCFYIPSSREFADFIYHGLGYGMLPDLQSKNRILSGKLEDLCPENRIKVDLYWHCWNMKSRILEALTKHLAQNANTFMTI